MLLDTCVYGGVAAALRDAGHEVEWVGEWPADPGDAAILARAHQAGQVLITLDKDFGELAVVRGLPHSGLIRLVGLSTHDQGVASRTVLDRYADELLAGAIVTVDARRVRIRPAQPPGS